MWQGYKNLVTELILNAQVVVDRFHFITQRNKELDTQIKKKWKLEELIIKAKLSSENDNFEKILSGLKNSKYPLLKNEDSLNEEQANKLIEVKNISPVLKDMHELKEKIIKIVNRTHDWYTQYLKSVCGYLKLKNTSPKVITLLFVGLLAKSVPEGHWNNWLLW